MPADASSSDHRDLDREDLLAIDVPALLGAGIGDGSGHLRGELQGTGAAAASVQVEEAGLPIEMLGRMLTMINRHTWRAAVADVDVIVEEPERRGYPAPAAIVRAGVSACRDDGDYALFARWLANVYGLAVLRLAGDAPAPSGPADTA